MLTAAQLGMRPSPPREITMGMGATENLELNLPRPTALLPRLVPKVEDLPAENMEQLLTPQGQLNIVELELFEPAATPTPGGNETVVPTFPPTDTPSAPPPPTATPWPTDTPRPTATATATP
ncbi:MAG TPA: hypothetical protein PKH77_18810, partial [Anaerolineae bacterium]|nr:hypothetical protein [Anaerolineae bacterium]